MLTTDDRRTVGPRDAGHRGQRGLVAAVRPQLRAGAPSLRGGGRGVRSRPDAGHGPHGAGQEEPRLHARAGQGPPLRPVQRDRRDRPAGGQGPGRAPRRSPGPAGQDAGPHPRRRRREPAAGRAPLVAARRHHRPPGAGPGPAPRPPAQAAGRGALTALPAAPGLTIMGGDVATCASAAALAERHGFESAWTAEFYDRSATVSLAAMAAATSRIELGSAIMYAFGRTPVVTIAEARDLDELTGGRFVMG